MANAKPEEGEVRTNVNDKFTNYLYKPGVAIYSNVGGMWKIKLKRKRKLKRKASRQSANTKVSGQQVKMYEKENTQTECVLYLRCR